MRKRALEDEQTVKIHNSQHKNSLIRMQPFYLSMTPKDYLHGKEKTCQEFVNVHCRA